MKLIAKGRSKALAIVSVCTAIALLIGYNIGLKAQTCSGQLIRQPEGLYCFSNLGQIQEDDVR